MKTLIAILNTGSPERTPEMVYGNMKPLFTNPEFQSGDIQTVVFTNKDWSAIKCKSANIPSGNYNIPMVNNIILNYAKANGYVFVHLLHDDVVVCESFNPRNYEKLMRDFGMGFYTYSRLNKANYVYEVDAPRFRLTSRKYYTHNVDFYTHEANEYCVIDLSKNGLLYDTRFEYTYNMAYIYDCKCHNLIPFLNFYIDVNYGDDMLRFDAFPRKQKAPEKFKSENALADSIGVKWVVDSNLDQVMKFFMDMRGVKC